MSEILQEHPGGCQCGAVRYTLYGDPTYCGNCHCRTCQKSAGAGVVTWVGVKPDNFKVTSGEITYYESSPGYQRGFCGLCSSSLTMTGEQYTDVGVTAATLDDCSVAKPESNVFLDNKPPWVIHNEALRNYNQGP
jgi:hypothetical protein